MKVFNSIRQKVKLQTAGPTTRLCLAVVLAATLSSQLKAQTATDPDVAAVVRPAPELDTLLGPVALYPDPLLAQVLAASTMPEEIAQASQWVANGGDEAELDQKPWSPSVKALVRYPEVLKYMAEQSDWTAALGIAFKTQPGDVMDSIQRLRANARSLGNLASTPEVNVTSGDDGMVEILPAEPDVIYVPVYEPAIVFTTVSSSVIVWSAHRHVVGVWLDMDMDWHRHVLFAWSPEHHRPCDWWARRPIERARAHLAGTVHPWHPSLPTHGSSSSRMVNHPLPQRPIAPTAAAHNHPSTPGPATNTRQPMNQSSSPSHPAPPPVAPVLQASQNHPPISTPQPTQPHPSPVSHPAAPQPIGVNHPIETPRPAPAPLYRPAPVERPAPAPAPVYRPVEVQRAEPAPVYHPTPAPVYHPAPVYYPSQTQHLGRR